MKSNNIKIQDKQPIGLYKIKEAQEKLNIDIVYENARAISDFNSPNLDLNKAKQKSQNALVALEAKNGLQSMIVAQILSIHELQQKSTAYANTADDLELKKYFTNTAIKLANCFVQQANILSKLQGVVGQKIIVERVDVHQGGQAIVGNIQGNMGAKDKK